ncbi:hypothetical protein ACJBUB_11080, partial [Streptococcus suis]
SGCRKVVYQLHDFSQSTSSPPKWLKEQDVQADLYSQERIALILEQGFKEKVLDKLSQAADFFRYHVEWGRNDIGSA